MQASPGNLQQLEEVLFRQGEVTSTCVMAVRLGGEARQRTVGVAYAEPAERRLGVAEFLDNDEFSNLEVMCLKDLVLEWGGGLKLISVYIDMWLGLCRQCWCS